MPLLKIQQEALTVIASNRHPGSHVAGGIAINQEGLRYSHDIDIFHDLAADQDRVTKLLCSADKDVASLEKAGFEVKWALQRPEFYRAIITKDDESTILEWSIDSDYRFFDAVKDDIFGYRLSIFDLAINKIIAAASRKEPRDKSICFS